MIPYGRQNISDSDIEAVIEVLKSDYLTQGPVVHDFEGAVKKYCGAEYAVAVNSATSALHIACLALDVGAGDIVWTTPITFVASANCALYCGAKVDFIDIDPDFYNLSVEKLEEKLIFAEKNNSLPKVLIPVHLAGQSCDMKKIYNLSKRYGFKIIEDASHCIGGEYCGKKIGNCNYSDITIFSFHPVKIITTAEGGLATTNDEKLAIKLNLLRSHGVTRDKELMSGHDDGPWYYEQICLGYNYRMTDLQAALGLSQMKRLDQFIVKRNQLADRYDRLLDEQDVLCPKRNPDCYSAFHLYIIRLNEKGKKASQREVFEFMRSKNIGVNLHYIPVYRQPFYKNMEFNPSQFLESEKYYSEAISIPLYPDLTEENQDRVVRILSDAIGC